MAQFRFRTRKVLWLGSYAVPLPYNKFRTTWSFAVPLPYKSFDFKSRSSASAQKNILWLEVPQFRFRTRNILCLEVQQFCFHTQNNLDLKFRSFAQYTVTWISAVPPPQEKTSFEISHFCFCTRTLLLFGKSTLIQPPTHFLIFVLSYMNDWPSEGQRNKGIGMLLPKVVINVWLREA